MSDNISIFEKMYQYTAFTPITMYNYLEDAVWIVSAMLRDLG